MFAPLPVTVASLGDLPYIDCPWPELLVVIEPASRSFP